MNIFFVNQSPLVAARDLPDKLVVKMTLESAQLLSTAHRVLQPDDAAQRLCDERGYYRATHKNHPSAVWCRESAANYRWLWHHLHALAYEYHARYGKYHAVQRTLLLKRLWLLPQPLDSDANPALDMVTWKTTSPHPLCMPEHFHGDSVIDSYRLYLSRGKSYINDHTAWARRSGGAPAWYTQPA